MIEDPQPAEPAEGPPELPPPSDHVFQQIAQSLADASKDWDPEASNRRPGGPLPRALLDALDDLVDHLGERWIGGPWKPGDDLPQHTTTHLASVTKAGCEKLTQALAEWSSCLGSPGQIHLLIYLWWECWQLWDRSFAYRALRISRVASDAAADSAGLRQDDWELAAWRAVAAAIGLITEDAELFKQVNLASTAGVAEAAERAAKVAAATRRQIDLAAAAPGPGLGQADDVSCLAREGLRYIGAVSGESEIFYGAVADVARTLGGFESWLADAARQGSARPPAAQSCRELARPRAPLLTSIEASLHRLHRAQRSLSGLTLSRCEPWERLLVDIREIVARDGTGVAGHVIVPKRVWVRYCYPFAVEENDECPLADLHPNLAQRPGRRPPGDSSPGLRARLQQELDEELMDGRVTVSEPVDLAPTEFFQALGSEGGLYGGVRVDLPEIDFVGDRFPGARSHRPAVSGRVWLDLNRMGNHCLCIELTEPLENPPPLPHLLYRALRLGTPFVYGEQVALAALPGSPADGAALAWDNLHTFARDIIRATAGALFWKDKKGRRPGKDRWPGKDWWPSEDAPAAAPFVRGNLHEVVIVQTDSPLGPDSESVADILDDSVGGRVLFRSIHRPAGTLDEWVRFPPLRRNQRQDRPSTVIALPELGFAGDWFVHTGETTVFGVVAVPSWLRDMYAQAAQFAGSWSPLLRLWNNRLESAIDKLRSDDDQGDHPQDLRKVEQRVRRHLSEINSEELCATLAYRRFLDELLEMAGVHRLERQLEAQLKAAEQLTDWFNEYEHQKGEQRRNILLFLIALLGVFSLGDFMALANQTHLRGSLFFIKLNDGVWEDWFVLIAFFLALLAGFFLLGAYTRLRRSFSAIKRKQGRGRSPAV